MRLIPQVPETADGRYLPRAAMGMTLSEIRRLRRFHRSLSLPGAFCSLLAARSSVLRPMRITGGAARGIPLTTGRATAVRPATDRMREAVFASLGALVEGARVLDLFAGTGAYGLEALSRGAAQVVAVERNRLAVAALERNLASVAKSLGLGKPPVRIVRGDVLTAPLGGGFDLVFADPPYANLTRDECGIFRVAANALRVDGPAVFLLEAPGEFAPANAVPGWDCVKRLGKGRGQPTVLRLERRREEGKNLREQLRGRPG